jgi:serine/threonine protein kinase
MVLEYIKGGTLFEKIKMNELSKRAQHMIFRDLCSAVEAMHANGIMHRDIKVNSILRKPAKPKSATLDLLHEWAGGRPYAVHRSIWRPK